MSDSKYWIPMRNRHSDEVYVSGPYNGEQAYRERRESLDRLGREVEIGIPILAETEAVALEKTKRWFGKKPRK